MLAGTRGTPDYQDIDTDTVSAGGSRSIGFSTVERRGASTRSSVYDSDSDGDSLPEISLRLKRLRPPQLRKQSLPSGVMSSSSLWKRAFDVIALNIQRKDTYVYQDIEHHNEIRTLCILPGNDDADLECVFTTCQIPWASPPTRYSRPFDPYIALSHCSRVDNRRQKLFVYNHHPDDTALSSLSQQSKAVLIPFIYVSDNVAAALRQFRQQNLEVDLWVDTICINHENLREKSIQASRMHDIFREAESVSIWLGEGTSETKETFDFLKHILNIQHLDELIKSRKNPKNRIHVVNLMKIPWFSRRWAIQELVFAKSATVH